MKAESRQIPQKLAARLKFVCCLGQRFMIPGYQIAKMAK